MSIEKPPNLKPKAAVEEASPTLTPSQQSLRIKGNFIGPKGMRVI